MGGDMFTTVLSILLAFTAGALVTLVSLDMRPARRK